MVKIGANMQHKLLSATVPLLIVLVGAARVEIFKDLTQWLYKSKSTQKFNILTHLDPFLAQQTQTTET